MSKGSPLAVVLPWKYSPYQDAVPTWYAFDFGLLVFRVLDTLDTLVAVTSGFVTLAASRLFGPDAAPAPRLATDKTTARPSAKRRRIQLPPRRESRAIGRMLLWSNDLTMLPRPGGGVNQKSWSCN